MSNIAAALVKARRQFGPALKDKNNPHFRSKYADLGACLDAVDDALLEQGIALAQETDKCDDGVMVRTVLIHESGERMDFGWLHVPASKHDAQGYGSALTYARRYSLMAACGIAPEDDDGNAASKRGNGLPASFRNSPTMGATEEVQDDERLDYLRTLGSVLKAMVDKGDVGKAYDKLLKEKLDDTEYTALWEILKEHSYIRSRLKAHGEQLRAAKKADAQPA
jgi:hypothetical protein